MYGTVRGIALPLEMVPDAVFQVRGKMKQCSG